jgi:hydrogenase maturation protein HypF
MTVAPAQSAERRRFLVRGVVQGVGFRPFVHNLARAHDLTGSVRNDGTGVVIEAQGEPAALDRFARALTSRAPQLARVESVASAPVMPRREAGFVIETSDGAPGGALVPPDVAICDDCLGELFDIADRRYRYPFINCAQCGPRFTIVRAVPYDRPNTTMAAFTMCSECRREYEDPSDRRFHAEPTACGVCGPRLSMTLGEAVALLRQGKILAVKGLGGYHLACDATNEDAVTRLRARKHRDEKPFAVMTADPWAPVNRCPWAARTVPRRADPRTLVDLSEPAEALLRAPDRPVVLAPRRPDAPIAGSVAPGNPRLGVMLPYTPLHYLLLVDFGGPLVMTSGNRSNEPIAFDDEDARLRLGAIADAFLAHDRPIHRRCEDSVVDAHLPVRRSRGRTPTSLALPSPASDPLIAAGAELKSTFCVARGGEAFLSPHLGDLDSEPAYRAFLADLGLYRDMLAVEPDVFACDLHPDYLSAKWAREQNGELIEIQHHHAHAASCLAEHGEEGPALALVFDGTGYGPDGTLWGGELLRCNLSGYVRLAHLQPVALPGGEAAIREPWRSAAAYLEAADRPVPYGEWAIVRESLKVNAPLSSGMGRLFDAVAALLGLRERVSYEGQAAIELEWLAGDVAAEPYRCAFDGRVIAGPQLVAAAYDDYHTGRPAAEIAAAFHEGVAAAAVRACAQAGDPKLVVLSGGTFQNLRLMGSVRAGLQSLGFRVLTHRLVPPNDGGISYGQAAVAARRTTCA